MPHSEHSPSSLPPVYVIGTGVPAEGEPQSPLEHPLLEKADVLVGGKSLLERFAAHPAEKLAVGADVEALYARMAELRGRGRTLLVLCSGDPLYFGLGARLAERFGPSAVRSMPGISSLQAAAAFLGIPWESMRSVSMHGRNGWRALAAAVICGGPVFMLCDRQTSPAGLAFWLSDRGCIGYRLYVLDNLYLDGLGQARVERHFSLRPADVHTLAEYLPGSLPEGIQRVMVLLPEDSGPSRPFGLEDDGLDKEGKLLTKLPVRAAGLAALGIRPADTVWDIGAGSGAVSIEAARLAWQGQVIAVECKPERIGHIRANRRRSRAINVEIVEGAFPACLERKHKEELLPRPDRIFVGGGLGGDARRAGDFLESAWRELLPGGRLLVHCVLLSSLEAARSVLGALGADLRVGCLQAAESSPLGGDIRLEALNPVFWVLAVKGG